MRYTIRRSLAILALGGLLAACGGPRTPPALPATATIATSAPTAAPAAEVVPTATTAPTVEPAPAETATAMATATTVPATATAPATLASVLPAPLYVQEGGQVVRIEPDGTTRTTLTNEQPFTAGALAITEIALSPDGATLAYVLQGETGNTLVLTDAHGANRRVLLDNVPVGTLRWSRDGSALAVQLSQPSGSDSPWKAGIWVVSAFSGEARLLIANDSTPSDGSGEAWGYAPEAWSPDGRKLLVARFSQVVETCDAAILDVVSGEVTTLQGSHGDAPSLSVQCIGGTWAADSSAVYVTLRGPGLAPPEPGLYRAEAISGVLEPVIARQSADGKYALVQSQVVGPDGALLALIAMVDQIPDPATDPNAMPPAALLYRVREDGALDPLRSDSFSLYGMPVWAPNGVGALLPTPVDGGGVSYVYVPVSGEVVRLQLEPTSGIAWGS